MRNRAGGTPALPFPPDRERVGGSFADADGVVEVALPEAVGGGGKLEEGAEVLGVVSLAEAGAPGVDLPDGIAAEFFDDLVGVKGHAGVAEEPVVNAVGWAGWKG